MKKRDLLKQLDIFLENEKDVCEDEICEILYDALIVKLGGPGSGPREGEPRGPYKKSNATTTQEASDYAKNEIGIEADYSGVSVEVANITNDVVGETLKDYPELSNIEITTNETKDELLATMSAEYAGDPGGKVYGGTTSFSNGKEIAEKYGAIYEDGVVYGLNPNTMKLDPRWNKKISEPIPAKKPTLNISPRLEEGIKNSEWEGYHPIGTGSAKGVIDHELGHAIDYQYKLSNNDKINKLYKAFSKPSRSLGMTTTEYENILGSELSVYAKTNKKEFIAECWCEYKNNPNPRELATKVGQIIETYKNNP